MLDSAATNELGISALPKGTDVQTAADATDDIAVGELAQAGSHLTMQGTRTHLPDAQYLLLVGQMARGMGRAVAAADRLEGSPARGVGRRRKPFLSGPGRATMGQHAAPVTPEQIRLAIRL